MYNALLDSYEKYLVAAKLDTMPNEKGKVKSKYLKDIKNTIKNNQPHFWSAGAYFYNEKDYNRYQRMKESTALEFMVCEYHGSINEVRKLKNSRYQLRVKNDRLKDKNDRLREKNEKLKTAKENLKAQVSRLKARIAEIENSTSFKIGKAITYLPGLIKKAIKGKK